VQHSTLVATGVRWLSRKCSVVLYEFDASAGENPDVIGWASGAVRQNPRAGMGQRRYYLCPPDVIQVADLPPKWGLLWVTKGQVAVKREARGHAARNLVAEIRFLTAMLRRAQIRIGSRPLSEWLRGENRFEAKRGISPNRHQPIRRVEL
jgi:hypothetical protein